MIVNRIHSAAVFGMPTYKLIGLAVLLVLTAAAILLLIVKKKAKPANLILTAVIGAVLITLLMLVNLQSADSYRSPAETAGEDSPAVELVIRCDSLIGRADPTLLQRDGLLFPPTRLAYIEGETVDELLTRAAKSAGFTVDREAGYVRGIAGIYEKAYGEMSGWIFTVNGEMPMDSALECILSPGDRVEWRYSTDLLSEMGS